MRSGERREVTRANGRGIIPGPFSPGGRYLAWDWCTTVTFPAECGGGIAVADLSRTPPTIVGLPPGDLSVAWSPDDSSLAVDGNEGDLSIANGDGSDPHVVGQGSFLAWSPDGERFAMMTKDRIEIRSRDGTQVTQIPVGTDRLVTAAWSPDGRTLAAQLDHRWLGSGETQAPAQMWLIDVGGHGQRAISLGPGCVELPSSSGLRETTTMDCRGVVEPAGGWFAVWSPDSRRLAFGLAPAGTGDSLVGVAIVDVESGIVTRLDDGGVPAWSPDGRHLMFVTTEGIDVVDADGSHRHQVLESPGRIDSKWGVWIPDESP